MVWTRGSKANKATAIRQQPCWLFEGLPIDTHWKVNHYGIGKPKQILDTIETPNPRRLGVFDAPLDIQLAAQSGQFTREKSEFTTYPLIESSFSEVFDATPSSGKDCARRTHMKVVDMTIHNPLSHLPLHWFNCEIKASG